MYEFLIKCIFKKNLGVKNVLGIYVLVIIAKQYSYDSMM